MLLAYECLRSREYDLWGQLYGAREALSWGDETAVTLSFYGDGSSAYRARLALLLRVLLRADAGDFGSDIVSTTVSQPGSALRVTSHRYRRPDESRRYTPLWETAGEARRARGAT